MVLTHYLGLELSGHSGCTWRRPGVTAGTYGPAMSRAETTPPNKQARPLGHRAKAGVVSVDSC